MGVSYGLLVGYGGQICNQPDQLHHCYDPHIHLEDIACHGVISDVIWDKGIHLEAAETERVELFAHFVPKASLTALASRGLSTPVKNGSNKAAALAGARTTPHQLENTRRSGRVMVKDIEEGSSSATKRGLNEVKQNASTPGKPRETNQRNQRIACQQ